MLMNKEASNRSTSISEYAKLITVEYAMSVRITVREDARFPRAGSSGLAEILR